MRRRIAVAVALALAFLLLLREPPGELARRARFLARTAGSDLPGRRLAGSSAAFDRRYFVFLESVRRTLPSDAAGVVLFLPAPAEQSWYLAAYTFAPIPVRLAPAEAPPRSVGAVYGPDRPPGWTVARELPGGAVLRAGREAGGP